MRDFTCVLIEDYKIFAASANRAKGAGWSPKIKKISAN